MTKFCFRPLLEKQRIFRSRDPDEVRTFLRGKEFRFDFSRQLAKQLDLQINGIYCPAFMSVTSNTARPPKSGPTDAQ